MKRTTAANHDGNRFKDSVPGTAAGTHVGAEDLNYHQEELARVCEVHGCTPQAGNEGQVGEILAGVRELDALNTIYSVDSGETDIYRCAAMGGLPTGIQYLFCAGDSGRISHNPNAFDGATQLDTQNTPADSYTGTWQGAVWTGATFVLCGTGGGLQSSPPPPSNTWVDRSFNSVNLTQIASNGVGKVMVLGSAGQCYFSGDYGETWDTVTTIPSFVPYDLAYNTELAAWVAIGEGPDAAHCAAYSTDDGASWEAWETDTSDDPTAWANGRVLSRDGHYYRFVFQIATSSGSLFIYAARALGDAPVLLHDFEDDELPAFFAGYSAVVGVSDNATYIQAAPNGSGFERFPAIASGTIVDCRLLKHGRVKRWVMFSETFPGFVWFSRRFT